MRIACIKHMATLSHLLLLNDPMKKAYKTNLKILKQKPGLYVLKAKVRFLVDGEKRVTLSYKLA